MDVAVAVGPDLQDPALGDELLGSVNWLVQVPPLAF